MAANVPPLDAAAGSARAEGLRQAAVEGSASLFSSCEECHLKDEIIQELGRILLLYGADPSVVDCVKSQGGVMGDSVLLVALSGHRISKADSIKKSLLDEELYGQSLRERFENPA